MPVFLQGRRAFLSSLRRRHRRCNPLSVHRVTDSGRAYPHRAYSCRACPAAATCHSYPHLAYFVAAACHSYPHLASPAAAAACHSYPHFAYFAVAAFGYRGTARTAPSPAWSEMPPRPASLLQFCPEHHHPEAPHGPQPLPLGLKCRHGPRPFCSSARSAARPVFLQLFYGTSHSRSPSLLCPGHKKTDGTAQRSVRRQKATNLSRQHHRGSSSTRQVSARA